MKVIKTKFDSKFKDDNFMMVLPSSDYYEIGESYSILEYGSDVYIASRILVHKKTIRANQIDNQLSYMIKGIGCHKYHDIMKSYYGWDQYKNIDILTFAIQENEIEKFKVKKS